MDVILDLLLLFAQMGWELLHSSVSLQFVGGHSLGSLGLDPTGKERNRAEKSSLPPVWGTFL
ncbi:MAG: hypothetical protein KA338_12715, partial [Chloroflexi bacterium]|nr:hypothetical protein [Chloroflexota bacterium]